MLSEFGKKQPMYYRDIATKALHLGLVTHDELSKYSICRDYAATRPPKRAHFEPGQKCVFANVYGEMHM